MNREDLQDWFDTFGERYCSLTCSLQDCYWLRHTNTPCTAKQDHIPRTEPTH